MKTLIIPFLLSFLFFSPKTDIKDNNEETIAVNDPWGHIDWRIRCHGIQESANGQYYKSTSGSCTYIDRTDDSEFEIGETEKNVIKSQLSSASSMLSEMGFNEPKLESSNSQWWAFIYPGSCSCYKLNCCENIEFNDPGVHGAYRKNLRGSPTREPRLFVRSFGEEEGPSYRSVTASHELFHAVAENHWGAQNSENKNGFPHYWISEGGAEAFGFYWARMNGINAESPDYREYDISLHIEGDPKAGDDEMQKTIAYTNWEFWDYVARDQGDFTFMKSILNQNYQTSLGLGAGVYQVHTALEEAGVPRGLYGMYKKFVKTELDEEYKYTKVYDEEIQALREETLLNLEDIEPIATNAGYIIIVPDDIEVEERESKKFALSIELEEENPSIHLYVEGAEVNGTFTKDITEAFRTQDSVKVLVRAANIHRLPRKSEIQRQIKVKAVLKELMCPLMPHGFKQLVYISENDGKKQLRVTYNLGWEPIENEEEVIDSMSLSIYSFALGQTIGTAALEVDCNEQGLVFQGMETATISIPQIPQMQNSENSSLEMNVVTNTNIIPHRPEPNSTLPNAIVVANSTAVNENELIGVINMDINSNLTNRRVIEREMVTVPAGTFNCWRIEYKSTATISLSGTRGLVLRLLERQLQGAGNANCTLWITENHGWVKQEIRSSSGTTIYELESRVRN